MNALGERLAELEHKQWQSWVKYISENYQTLSVNTLIATWAKNFLTDYKDLSEEEKNKDRVWADKILTAFTDSLPKEKGVAELEEQMGPAYNDLSVKVAYKEGYLSYREALIKIIKK